MKRETINSRTSTCSSTSDKKWVLNETKQNGIPMNLMTKIKELLSWTSSAIWISEIAYRSKFEEKHWLTNNVFSVTLRSKNLLAYFHAEGSADPQAKELLGYFHGYVLAPCLRYQEKLSQPLSVLFFFFFLVFFSRCWVSHHSPEAIIGPSLRLCKWPSFPPRSLSLF